MKSILPQIAFAVALGLGTLEAAWDQDTFETLQPSALNFLRGTRPKDRDARLSALGVTRDSWFSQFALAVQQCTALGEPRVQSRSQTRALYYGLVLSELLHEDNSSPLARQLVTAPNIGEGVRYLALLVLAQSPDLDKTAVEAIDSPDPAVAWVAILALGVRDDSDVKKRLEEFSPERRGDPRINSALQFLDLYRHDRAQYAKIATVANQLAFVEQRLRRAFNPINGATEWSDPYSAGHPVSRWAFERWRELGEQAPEALSHFVQTLDRDMPAPIAQRYREFLMTLAGMQSR